MSPWAVFLQTLEICDFVAARLLQKTFPEKNNLINSTSKTCIFFIFSKQIFRFLNFFGGAQDIWQPYWWNSMKKQLSMALDILQLH